MHDWIAEDESAPYEIVNAHGRSRVILTCDHASARIPRRLGDLGVAARDLERHIAWDIGAARVARLLSRMLDAPLVLAGYSRLVVDCNRPLSADDAFASRSESVDVPGNASLDESERKQRADCFYWPYHDAIDELVTGRADGVVPVLVSMHTFTPVYDGQRRPWDIGVLHRVDGRLASLAIEYLRDGRNLVVGENEPYGMALDEDFTVPVHAERRGIPGALIEIRQDHVDSRAGVEAWTARLDTMLETALDHPSLGELGEAALDAHEPRYAETPAGGSRGGKSGPTP